MVIVNVLMLLQSLHLTCLSLVSDPVVFPEELHSYGLDEQTLVSVFQQVQKGKEPLVWSLKGILNNGFYQKLHPFLKKWSVTCGTTKVAIGKFYIAIDRNLRERSRADNVYRFIERVAKSTQLPDEVMKYDDNSDIHIKSVRVELKQSTEKVETLSMELSELRQQLEASRRQLHSANCALRDVTNEKLLLKEQWDAMEKQAVNFQKSNSSLKEEIANYKKTSLTYP